MTTFSYTPEFGATGAYSPNVVVNKYGDGYEQRVQAGMNSVAGVWNLQFANRESAEGLAIMAFLAAREGVEAFIWTPPLETDPLVFVCRKWEKSPAKGSRLTITATFEQVFEP